MYGRNQIGVYRTGNGSKVSAARTLKILTQVPTNQPELIVSIRNDWSDIEQGIVRTIALALAVSVRAHGHQAITENLPDLLKQPNNFTDIAHESYIENVTKKDLRILDANQVRLLFPHIEMSDGELRAIMRKAVELVERTPDEPRLIVAPSRADSEDQAPSDIYVTFAPYAPQL